MALEGLMIISVTQRASCPLSSAIEFARSFFTELTEERLAERLSSPELSCEIVVDATDETRLGYALKLDWEHAASFLLPTFHGTLTVRPAFTNVDLKLEGTFGSLRATSGNALDAIALAVTQFATRSLLQRIVSHVEAEWIAFSASCPSIAQLNSRKSIGAEPQMLPAVA